MRKNLFLAGAAVGLALVAAAAANAVDLGKLVGTWKWMDFTVKSETCNTNPSGAGLCMKVIAGPENIGMEMIRSKFQDKPDGSFFGKIAHPATGQIYNTKMTLKGDVWHMDGCTDAGVCATGDFVRQK